MSETTHRVEVGRLTHRRASTTRTIAARRGRQRDIALGLVAGLACGVWATPPVALAQSWSAGRTEPRLQQIVAVDESGEPAWPYGAEDIARDAPAFLADEAATDIRTLYADSDAQRLWLRAYVVAPNTPPENVEAYFFIDADDRDDTGGPASGGPGWPAFESDPTAVGYERAVGMRIEPAPMLPSVIGAWSWDGAAWVEQKLKKDDVRAEAGVGADPLRVGTTEHGYLQVDAVHAVAGLDAACGGNLLVRTFYRQTTPPRAFGDDTRSGPCRPGLDAYGDPDVIRVQCTDDAQCPNRGRCSEGVCLFAYACSNDGDCEPDERCMANACVRVSDRSCADASQCDGLVCESERCVACADAGARACAEGYACSPDGSCVDTENPGHPGSPGNAGGAGGAGGTGEVRGGAFKCAAGSTSSRLSWSSALLGLLVAGCSARRRWRATRRAEAGRAA